MFPLNLGFFHNLKDHIKVFEQATQMKWKFLSNFIRAYKSISIFLPQIRKRR